MDKQDHHAGMVVLTGGPPGERTPSLLVNVVGPCGL